MFGSLAKMANVVRLFVLIFPTAPSIFVQRKYLLRIPSVRINWLAQSFSSFSLKNFLHLPATFNPTFDISCIWSISFIPENTCGLFPFFPFYCSMSQFRCRERDGWRGTSPSPRCPMPIKRISRDDARLWFIQAGGYFTFLLVIPYEFFLTKSLKNS